ncbi:MAG: glycosyltransferase family 2 protein, partial [Candidatus Aenigmatarchaeota archaeon]
MFIIKLIFWVSFTILFYTWVGYPSIIYLLTKIKRKPKVPTTPDELPLVSIIIAA